MEIKEFYNKGVLHYYDEHTKEFISQHNNVIKYKLSEYSNEIRIPVGILGNVKKICRLGERLFRTDKGSCVYLKSIKKVLIFYDYRVFRLDIVSGIYNIVKLNDFRVPLYSGILNLDDKRIYFGEYLSNWEGMPVRIYFSEDGGETWRVIYTFEKNTIFHVHSIKYDHYTDKLWVFTGDFDGQCRVLITDKDFKKVNDISDGGQIWRAISPVFYEDVVYWGMDSPLQESFLMKYDRKSRVLSRVRSMPGPVWFSKQLNCEEYLVQTTVEHKGSLGVKSDFVHLYLGRYDSLTELGRWQKDVLPNKYFRHGLVSFVDGRQSTNSFIINCEAIKSLDGNAYICTL